MLSERKAPENSAKLYKIGTKRIGNDGNTWIIGKNEDGLKRWALYKKKIINTENNTKGFSDFNSFDFNVYDKIKEYKGVYEMIMKKSLDYKIDINPENIVNNETIIKYSKTKSNLLTLFKKRQHETKMIVIGYLEGNNFKWYNSARYYYLNHGLQLIYNEKVLESIKKLFSSQLISLPNKYSQIIIYLLSLFGNPNISNFIRLQTSDNILFFINIKIPILVPNFEKLSQYIIYQLNEMTDELTDMKNKNNIKTLEYYSSRKIKDNIKGHKINYNINLL